MNVTKVLIPSDSNTTSMESHEKMLKSLERTFDTGPIIGESREVIFSLMRNLYIRDLLLDAMNITEEKRLELFLNVEKVIDEKDKEIMLKREAEPKTLYDHYSNQGEL